MKMPRRGELRGVVSLLGFYLAFWINNRVAVQCNLIIKLRTKSCIRLYNLCNNLLNSIAKIPVENEALQIVSLEAVSIADTALLQNFCIVGNAIHFILGSNFDAFQIILRRHCNIQLCICVIRIQRDSNKLTVLISQLIESTLIQNKFHFKLRIIRRNAHICTIFAGCFYNRHTLCVKFHINFTGLCRISKDLCKFILGSGTAAATAATAWTE